MGKKIGIGLTAGAALLVLLGSWWLVGERAQPPLQDGRIVSKDGIHWHPSLEIYVQGKEVKVPANVGVGPGYAGLPTYGNGGMAMTAVHTHEDVPVIHLEFSGAVKEEDIMLGTFFRIWSKDMRSLGSNVRMSVNGVPSTILEDYVMRDGDKIELRYD